MDDKNFDNYVIGKLEWQIENWWQKKKICKSCT